jgi:hypothetical protein
MTPRKRKKGRRGKVEGGGGRTFATVFLLLLITVFGISIYLGRVEGSGRSGGADEKGRVPRADPASLDLPAPDIVPDAQSPTLVVWNGCGRAGLGARVGRWMRRAGFDVFEATNADRSDYRETLIVIRSDRLERAERIAEFVRRKLGVGRVIHERARAPEADVLLILGSDIPDSLPAY